MGFYSRFSFEEMHRNRVLSGFIQGFGGGQDSILKLNSIVNTLFLAESDFKKTGDIGLPDPSTTSIRFLH